MYSWLVSSTTVLCALFYVQGVCGAYVFDDSVGVERKFDGIGGLSGGGATSKLLVSYPEKERNEILDYLFKSSKFLVQYPEKESNEILDFLFKPNFGASLQILKVEIGGDAQSTDGTESSHMHESWDENYQRGYEWWLMLEAKQRNPDIKLYGLPWAFPGWVGHGGNSPYKYPNDTALYVVKWILAAKRIYNLTIDYVGIWNERDFNIVYVETLKDLLVSNNLGAVQIVVADGGWGVSNDILKDVKFASTVDVIGCHYPGTESDDVSMKTNKPLWASEDYSTYNDDVGAGCWARILNQNYVNGYMTSTISWNLIASYYESLPFGRDGLMTGEEPWSGHYVVDNPIWITAHTTQFADIGWSYLKHGSGVGHLDFGGSYVTLASPDLKDFTIVIETMSHEHSKCIRPGLPAYNVTAQQAEFVLKGSLEGIKELFVWRTQLKFGSGQESTTVFERLPPIKPYAGMFTLTFEIDQVYTLTTRTSGQKGSYPTPPPSQEFPLPYQDQYEQYQEYSEAYNFVPQSGVWEVRQTSDPKHGKVNRQVLLSTPIYWCNTGESAINVGGNSDWENISVRSDVFIPTVNGTSGVFVAAQVKKGGCDVGNSGGVFFIVYPGNSTYCIVTDLARRNILAQGSLPHALKNDTWYTLQLIVKQGSNIYWSIDSDYLGTAVLPHVSKGYAGYGTTSLGLADFDNLLIQSSESGRRRPIMHRQKDYNVQHMWQNL